MFMGRLAFLIKNLAALQRSPAGKGGVLLMAPLLMAPDLSDAVG
jgi:hypothetical protein